MKTANAKRGRPRKQSKSKEPNFGFQIVRSPLVNLTIEATQGGPALAGMIAHVLHSAGAKVKYSDLRIRLPDGPVSLGGLTVFINRVVWVREEEGERW